MHVPPNTTTRSVERTTTTPDYILSESGKVPNPCHFFMCFTQTNKSIKEFIFSQQNNITSNKLVHKAKTRIIIIYHAIIIHKQI